ncbi:alpha/beta hydrolase [Brevibacillus ruminantium]|uniref:Alpha/beta hydrolase n=1 Tax=Brevibacillus ruminantium TaxID=2950604 RepID=A0ABY4WLZ8_9BACL|nr:alpha/beta hydrolase [Brevibacillus ruminantium]USG68181.1 alpha/beta hydrolase [Brevibacillus ruminantium]
MHIIWQNKISYTRRGQGFPLVILHAMGTDHRAMMAWMEPLFEAGSNWERIYIDLPAHGHSLVQPWMKTSADILSVILDFLDDLIPNRQFALVGKSFGGYIAQGILAKKQEYLDGLFLLTPALHIKERSLPPRFTGERDEELLAELDPDIRGAFETLVYTQTEGNLHRFLEEVQPGRLLADRPFLTSEWRTKGYFFPADPLSDQQTFTAPTLFLLGRQDFVCGYQDHWTLLERFPHAAFTVLDGVGHLAELEKREVVQTLCKEWLGRVDKTKSL